jgi:hypothetical protein
VTVDAVDPDTGEIRRVPLELGEPGNAAQVRLELTPGASSVQVVTRSETDVLSWIEIPAQSGEQMTVEFRRSPTGEVRAFSMTRDFLILPDDEPPSPLLIRPRKTDELDLIVLVDGTCLHPNGANDLAFLLGHESAEVWKSVVSGIEQFVLRITAKYPRLWATVMAFGDEQMPMLANNLLKPTYLIHPPSPAARRLENMTPAQLSQRLRSLPPTPGGDFVDALADGLQACSQAPWRENSRKLVLVFGQSPGYSVLDATDDMTNLLIRKVCLEEEIAALYNKGVEVVTIFHEPTEAEERYKTDLPDVLQRARDQYRNLASLPSWSCVSPALDLEDLASKWVDPPLLLARGPSPGLLAHHS